MSKATAKKIPQSDRLTGSVTLADKPSGEGAEVKQRTFTMSAYTGAVVNRWWGRLVIDLAGMTVPKQSLPILRNHNPDRIVGFSQKVSVEKGVMIEGVLSSVTADGKEVAALSDEDFPWQASIGIDFKSIEHLREGATATVNGQTITGPCEIARQSVLKESSFVPLGADSNTSSQVLADHQDGILAPTQTEVPVTESEFLAFGQANPGSLKKLVSASLTAMLAAFPGREKFAAEQFAEGKSLEEARALDAQLQAYAKSEKDRADALEKENTKLKAQVGTQDALATAGTGAAVEANGGAAPSMPANLSPEDQARWEFKHKPAMAEGLKEEIYVKVRVAELDGRVGKNGK